MISKFIFLKLVFNPFHKVDVRDKTSLIEVFQQHSIDGVIHFAVKDTWCWQSQNPDGYPKHR